MPSLRGGIRGVPWLLGAILLLLYVRPLILGETFAARDHVTWTLPSRAYLAERLKSGEIPAWWSAVGTGIPFAAHPGHGVTYPPVTAALTVLPGDVGADLLLVAHLLFGALGVHRLSRRLGADRLGGLVAGLVFGASGYVTSMVVNGMPLLTLAWTPWVSSAALALTDAEDARGRHRAALALAALWGMQILSGDPAGLLTGGIVVLVVLASAGRRALFALPYAGVALAAAVGLAAVSVAPALALLGDSERAAGLSLAESSVWSFHPARLLEWVWPRAFGDPAVPSEHLARAVAATGERGMGASWSMSVYLGLPALFLAACCGTRKVPRGRALLAGAGVCLVLALGSFTPVYAAWRFVVLPERLVRFPEKHLAGVVVLVAALSGVGFSRLFDGTFRKRVAVAAGVCAGGLLVAVAGARLSRGEITEGLAEAAGRLGLDVEAALADATLSGISAAVAALAFAGALLLPRRQRLGRWARPVAVGALALPLLMEAWTLLPHVERAALRQPPAILEGVAPGRLYRDANLVARVTSSDAALDALALHHTAAPNVAAPFGFVHVPGYEPALPWRFRAFWRAGREDARSVLYRRGANYVILPEEQLARARGVAAAGPSVLGLAVGSVETRPRAFWVDDYEIVADFDAVLERVFQPSGPALVLEGEPGRGAPQTHVGPVPCAIDEPRPESISLRCHAQAPGYVVLLDGNAPGWSATVDGAPVPILTADGLFRAVPVSPGTHTIQMTYETPGLTTGAWVSLLTLLLLLGDGIHLLTFGSRRRG